MTESQTLDATSLDALLKKIAQGSTLLLPDELDNLFSAFTASQPASLRSKAYLVLSSYCQSVRNSTSAVDGKQPDPATERLVEVFAQAVADGLDSTGENTLLSATSFLSALFQVDWESASVIFQNGAVLSSIMEMVDIIPTPSIQLAAGHLFAQACSHKACRAIITSDVKEWLQVKSQQTADTKVRAAAAIALIKLSKGSVADAAEVTGNTTQAPGEIKEDDLAGLMKGLIMSDEANSSVQDAVEGLAYLSIDANVKNQLSKDKIFLKKLFSLAPSKKAASSNAPNNSLIYGILLLVSNICAYRPRLTEEQQHIEKLKKMTKPNSKSSTSTSDEKSELDDDLHVKERVRRMVDAGVLTVFAAASAYVDSPGIRTCTAEALLSIVEDKDHRGKVLQSGGAKALGLVIQRGLAPAKESKNVTKDNAPLEAIQALAKLSITSAPIQVFGASEGAMYDAIRPFSILVQHESSMLLQRFEGMMALTNLATQSPEMASRIAKAEGLMDKVESLLFEDHTLVRRAAMELICNLIGGSDDIFDKYGGNESAPGAKSKLHIVLALSDVDDLPTRIAASGALATLTISPAGCRILSDLQQERHRALHILTLLIDSSSIPEDKKEESDEFTTDVGLIHRGVVCVRNLFININDDKTLRFLAKEAQEAGLVAALGRVVKGEIGGITESILRPTVEALKRIAEYLK